MVRRSVEVREKHRQYTQTYRKEHPEFCERQRDKRALYRQEHPEKCRLYTIRNKEKNRKLIAAKQRLYVAQNPEKVKTQQLSQKLPLLEHCELCPPEDMRTTNLEHHHPDHNYPEIYVTACPSCHKYAEGYGFRLIQEESAS